MRKKTKIILVSEFIFLIAVFAYSFAIKPTPVFPSSGFVVKNNDFIFEFKNARKLILSREPDFKHPLVFDKDFEINLPPGTYYWKLKNLFRESEVRNFTVYSRISLMLDQEAGELVIYNTGNVGVNLTILNGEEVFNRGIVDEGFSKKFEDKNEENTIIKGKQI